ncbi:MAG TPA: hypothetical protein VHD55_02260 [Candidatus Paceibacterota bacterium]|nr:hypothetical protein [Candidatus Paceibacterota bacterium]
MQKEFAYDEFMMDEDKEDAEIGTFMAEADEEEEETEDEDKKEDEEEEGEDEEEAI